MGTTLKQVFRNIFGLALLVLLPSALIVAAEGAELRYDWDLNVGSIWYESYPATTAPWLPPWLEETLIACAYLAFVANWVYLLLYQELSLFKGLQKLAARLRHPRALLFSLRACAIDWSEQITRRHVTSLISAHLILLPLLFFGDVIASIFLWSALEEQITDIIRHLYGGPIGEKFQSGPVNHWVGDVLAYGNHFVWQLLNLFFEAFPIALWVTVYKNLVIDFDKKTLDAIFN